MSKSVSGYFMTLWVSALNASVYSLNWILEVKVVSEILKNYAVHLQIDLCFGSMKLKKFWKSLITHTFGRKKEAKELRSQTF